MISEIDPNKIVVEATVKLISDTVDNILHGASSRITTAWSKVFPEFKPYLGRTLLKNQHIRILCVKDKDVNLEDIYVSSNFECQNESVSDYELISKIVNGARIVVSGNGGAGKTIFMRKAWLHMFSQIDTHKKIPIFVELRSLNELSSPDITALIRHTLSETGKFSEELFQYFCKKGGLIFQFDGLDEVSESIRRNVQDQIKALAATYPNCGVVVSSRPDKNFSGWQGFLIYKSCNFNIDQVKDLISKIPFKETSKKLFLKRLDEKFYKEQSSFLSNPLLTMMLLMSFKDHMDIPETMNIFYDQAFTTLFTWHDASKDYDREISMNIDEFRKCFGLFCLFSYFDEIYEFSQSQIFHYIERSKSILNITVSTDTIIRDFVESVNLMQIEGVSYIFIHRSFQEYFSAYAVINIVNDKYEKFMFALLSRTYDDFFPIAYEMNQNLFTKHVIRPIYDRHLKSISKRPAPTKPYRILTELGFKLEIIYKQDRFHSLGIAQPRDLYCFLSNCQNITNRKGEAILSVYGTELPFMSYTVFSKITDFFEDGIDLFSGVDEFSILLDFSETEVNIELKEYSGNSRKQEKVFRTLCQMLQEKSNAWEEFSALCLKQIGQLSRWCDQHIERSNQRGDSIDEILSHVKLP